MLRPAPLRAGGDTVQTSRVARLAGALGVLAVVCAAAGPGLIQLGAVKPYVGFLIFGLGGVIGGLLALVLGLLGLVFTRPSAYREGRRRALLGLVLGALVLGIAMMGGRGGAGVPAINDITTNPDDPPAFPADPSGEGRNMAYPGDAFAQQQRAGYPDLAPIQLADHPADAFARVEELFKSYGWEVTQSDPVSLTLLATDTSRLFRFVDDIVVRVRPSVAGGAVVDMRSKSRVGKGDMGVNAARIRRLREGLGAAH
jgi:uncharacterized protein (DUF1499 family)